VAANGTATIDMPGDGGGAMPAVALHTGQKLSSTPPPPAGSCAVTFTIANANTVFGENLYVAGSVAALGSWAPAAAPAMAIQGSGANVPWRLTINLPASTPVQYKYIKRNGGSTVWEGNHASPTGNREFTTCAAGGSMNRSDGNFKF
jgi:alpha-amylase